jgi:hypothetical protein
LGVISGVILLTQVGLDQILVSLILLGIGVPIYVFFSPKKELHDLKEAFLSREAVLKRSFEQGEVFLGHLVRHVKLAIYRVRKRKRAWRTYR